jgi:hypothetical protein
MQIKSYVSIEIQFAEQSAEKQIGLNTPLRIEAEALPAEEVCSLRQAAVQSALSPGAS